MLLPPLCNVAEIFHLLTPYEVYILLRVIWRYVKENPPVPDPREDLGNGNLLIYLSSSSASFPTFM